MYTHNFIIHSEYDENGLNIQKIILNVFHNFMALETASATGNTGSILPDQTGKTES